MPRIKRDGDFKDLVTQSTIFADKSLFIQDVIEDADTTLLIAMPRRWGKTVNLDMLKRFLEIPVDENGELLDNSETDNYKLFAGGYIDGGMRGEVTLLPLNIADARFFNNVNALAVQGTFPVIYIDFKNCKASDYNTIEKLVRAELGESFRRHAYLKDSIKLTDRQRELVSQYLDEAENTQIIRGLKVLSSALHDHYNGKKVWILVDEYDAVANVAYRDFNEEDLTKTINLFSGIYETALKSNPHLEKGVMIGVQYIAQSGMLSGLNNLGKFDFTSAKYAQHYGLDQAEIDLFFDHFSVPSHLSTKVKDWYNGYKAPKYTKNTALAYREFISKYNIWSIVSYLKEGEFYEFKSHWEKSGSIDFLDKLFKKKKVREKVEQLVDGVCLVLDRKDDFSANDFKTLKELLGGNKEITEYGLDVLFSYLFIGGYLTLAGRAG
jgi:hypothetical protein